MNAMFEDDPFTGTWKFNGQRSKLDTPLPQSWIQEMVVSPSDVVVREKIVRWNGVRSEVRIRARFDGTDYPVADFPIADTMAYQRQGLHSISGIGKKCGVVCLTETLKVAPDGSILTVVYSIQSGASQVARGIAVFSKGLTAIQ